MGLETLGETASLVKEIERIHHAKPEVTDLFGVAKLVTVEGTSTKYDDPKLAAPQVLPSSTLDGVVDFVEAGLVQADLGEALAATKFVVQILGPTQVDVVVPSVGPYRQKFTYLTAKPARPDLILNRFIDLEPFMIQLQAGFAQTDEQGQLLSFLGSYKVENAVEMADDGIAQTVKQKTGVTRTETVEVKNPWRLSPDRTFVEVEQPDSAFILRLNTSGQAALFEADGGAWRVEAVKRIKAYLVEKLPEGTIVLS